MINSFSFFLSRLTKKYCDGTSANTDKKLDKNATEKDKNI